MAMFDYGREKSGETYTYQFLQQNLQSGYYPIDNFQNIVHYSEPQMSSLGIPVWGEISYSKPLTQEQCNRYEFLERPKEPVRSMQMQQPMQPQQVEPAVEDARVPESVVLHGVKSNRIFDSKNGDYKLISMRYADSDTGYCNYAVPAKQVTKNQDGTYDMILGTKGQMRNLSILKNGKPELLHVSVESIEELYQTTLVFNPTKKSDTLAFLNSVDKKFVRDTKNPSYKVVSIPYADSENGYAKLTVPTANIFDTKVNGKTVPFHVNVNIGPESGSVPVSIKKNGSFTRIMMSASDLVQMQKDAVANWQRQSLQNAQEIAAKSPEYNDDVVYE